jgi:hypothetical protein
VSLRRFDIIGVMPSLVCIVPSVVEEVNRSSAGNLLEYSSIVCVVGLHLERHLLHHTNTLVG